MRQFVLGCWLAVAVLTLSQAGEPRSDIVLADFEGDSYGDWKTTGTAFGDRPARGTLPRQMPVTGYRGEGLVNSFNGGDAATGTLTSPEFTLNRKFVAFLIGGGGHVGKTCLNLVVGGKVVRSTTGPNVNPGGSEELAPAFWEVGEWEGQKAQIVVVDEATGGWGHINVDHIVLTDTKPVIKQMTTLTRELILTQRYLHLPVSGKGPKQPRRPRVSLEVGGVKVREFEIELGEQPEWFAHLDVSAWKGQKARLSVEKFPEDSPVLDLVKQADTIADAATCYHEPLRSQQHFSPRRGWTNDPNGMVYSQGEYHLYFQHNPFGWNWGNMHWGHAVSRDLVHWEELPIAIYPAKFGDWVFSGSAVVDRENSSGWKTGENELLVAAFTSTGRSECIVYSNDRGRTWTEYEHNPVVKHAGRDPRLLWHAGSNQWVMAVYDEFEKQRWIAFYTSPDLKKWTFQSRSEGYFECPDLFELPLDGESGKRKWILTAADSNYRVGTFDGQKFQPETAKLKGSQGVGFYAAQTFSNEPSGRVVQIGWLKAPSPKMPFNQCMSLPLQLKLRPTADGPRLTWWPVAELTKLRQQTHELPVGDVPPDRDPLEKIAARIGELEVEFAPGKATQVEFQLRGITLMYDAAKQELVFGKQQVPVTLVDGKLRLRVFVDRTCVEVFVNDGQIYLPHPAIAEQGKIGIQVHGGAAQFTRLNAYELGSIWPERK